MQPDPLEGKVCEWPRRQGSRELCRKPAVAFMQQYDEPGRWSCGIHTNSAWSRGWHETGSPEEYDPIGEEDDP